MSDFMDYLLMNDDDNDDEKKDKDEWRYYLSDKQERRAKKYNIDPWDYDKKSEFKEALREARDAHKLEKEMRKIGK